MSNEIVPQVDLNKFNNESMRQMADGARAKLVEGSDDIANLAVALVPMIKETMRLHGADGNTQGSAGNLWNVFGDPGSAERASKHLHNAMKKAADAMENAAAHLTAAYRLYMAEVHEPIEEAKRRRAHGSTQTLDY